MGPYEAGLQIPLLVGLVIFWLNLDVFAYIHIYHIWKEGACWDIDVRYHEAISCIDNSFTLEFVYS